jgi:hypothetical protein
MRRTVSIGQDLFLDASCACGKRDTVGELPKQRTYALYSTEFKELARLKLNSPAVSNERDKGKKDQLALAFEMHAA